MKSRTRLVLVLGTLFLFAAFAVAQGQTDAQITKGPVVEHTDANSAVIAWSTNVSASSVVKYGTDRNNLDKTAQMPWGGLTHRVTIKNLEPGKTYYYQVTSGQAQGSGTGALSGIEQFSTQANGGSSASNSNSNSNDFKIVNGPVVEHTGDTNATVAWTTDRPSSSVVKYGTDRNNLNQTAQEPWGATTHRVQLKNLQPGTQYYFSVHSAQGKNAPGQAEDTEPQPFTTTGTAQASNSGSGQGGNQLNITNGPVVENVADTNATVAWSTNLPSSSVVKYGTDPNNLTQTAQESWGQTTHRVQLKNLQPNTQYYFSVHSAQGRNAPGQQAEKGPMPFKTAAPGQSASK